MTPVRYRGSTNGCLHPSEALRSVLAAAGVRGGRDAGVAAEHKAERLVCNYYGAVTTEVAPPPHALSNTPRAPATTTRLLTAELHLMARVSNHLPAAVNTYCAPQPPGPQQPHTLTRPRAGRTTLAEMRVLRSTCSRAPAPTKSGMPSFDEVHKAAIGSAEELCAVWWLQSPAGSPASSLRASCRKSQARVRGQVDRSFHREEPTRHHTYLIDTVENHHRRPLTPRNCRSPAP